MSGKNIEVKNGEVWYVKFPLEEDINKHIKRPVIVIDEHNCKVLSVKVTKTKPRKNDQYDTPIVYWKNAKLRFKSTARVAKTQLLNKSMFITKIGDLFKDDLIEVERKLTLWYQEKISTAKKQDDGLDTTGTEG